MINVHRRKFVLVTFQLYSIEHNALTEYVILQLFPINWILSAYVIGDIRHLDFYNMYNLNNS